MLKCLKLYRLERRYIEKVLNVSQREKKAIVRDRIFLSYAHEDLPVVLKVYKGLKKRKLNVWLDKEDLGTGRWKDKITTAINKSRYFIFCLSEASLRKTSEDKPGFADKELNTAYNIAREQPDDVFTIIPVRLEDCDRGDFRLTGFQQYDLFEDFEKGLDKLAIEMGGISLADATAKDEKIEGKKTIEHLMGKAEIAFYAGEYKNALLLWESIIVINSDICRPWHNKGVVLVKLGQYQEAIVAFDKAIQIKPDLYGSWFSKGVSLEILGQNHEAIKAFDEAIKIKPDFHAAWLNKGAALGKSGQSLKAIKALDEAIKIKPDYHEAWHNKGFALANSGYIEDALEAVNKALEIMPDNKGALKLKEEIISKRRKS